jgi:biuret amidohydrolase
MSERRNPHSPEQRLRSLLAPERCAVLLQEVQEGIIGTTSGLPELAQAAREASLIANAQTVVKAARLVQVPVIHCTAENLPNGFGSNVNARLFMGARKSGLTNLPGSESVKPIPAVGPAAADIVMPRLHGLSPLTGSSLDSLLRNRGVHTLVVMGVSLNIAIPNLVFDAVNRAYQVVLVSDAVAGVPPEYAQQVIQYSLSLVSTLAASDEVAGVWSSDGGS